MTIERLADAAVRGIKPPMLGELDRLPLTTDVPTAGAWLGLSRGSAYAAARKGEIPTESIGGRRVVIVPRLLEHLGVAMPAQNDSEPPVAADGHAPIIALATRTDLSHGEPEPAA